MIDINDTNKLNAILNFAAKTIRRNGSKGDTVVHPALVSEKGKFFIGVFIHDDAATAESNWRDVLSSLGAVELSFCRAENCKAIAINGRFSAAKLAHLTEFYYRISPIYDCGGHIVYPLREIVPSDVPIVGAIYAPRKGDAYEWITETLRRGGATVADRTKIKIDVKPAAHVRAELISAVRAAA